jgi:hypothetical protein
MAQGLTPVIADGDGVGLDEVLLIPLNRDEQAREISRRRCFLG